MIVEDAPCDVQQIGDERVPERVPDRQAFLPCRHDAVIPQHAELLRDDRLVERERVLEFLDRPPARHEDFQQADAGGMGQGPDASDQPLSRVIDHVAHLLPAQGPISIFIHHNTLHAFEHLPFEEAVEAAAATLGNEPFLAESRYRDKLASGRILPRDVDALLGERLGPRGQVEIAAGVRRFDLWRALVLHGIPAARGRELQWILDETTALSRFRTDVPAHARAASADLRDPADREGEESRAVRRLWQACLEGVERAGEGLSRSGSRLLGDAREGPRHPWLLPGELQHGPRRPVRPLGPDAPTARRG
jgi:hypothetical protein